MSGISSSSSSSSILNNSQRCLFSSDSENISSSLSNFLSPSTESSDLSGTEEMSEIDFKSVPYDFAKKLFFRALKDYDLQTCLKIISTHESKINELLELRNTENINLLHILADQINRDQKDGELSSLKEKPFELLSNSKISNENRLKLIKDKDVLNDSFLDLAVFCKLEKFNFVHQILKLIPKEYRADCYKEIDKEHYTKVLNEENLDALLGYFYLSKDKFSVLRITNEKNNMNLLHMLMAQIIKKATKYIDELIRVLKKIPVDKRKDIVMTKSDSGRSIVHLAALVKDNNYALLLKILELIPEKDRAVCLKTNDYLKGFSPMHQIADLTTNENDLSNKIIGEILNLLPEEDRKGVEEVKDLLGRTYKEIQQLKKEKE